MLNYEKFLKNHQPKKQFGYFADSEIQQMGKKLPEEVVTFLATEGRCSYANNFLWTARPSDFYDALSQWGLRGAKCETFLRTAFGACIYYHSQKYYYLDPILGRIGKLGDDFNTVMNVMLVLNVILIHGFFEDQFSAVDANPQLLHPDEIFALVPALPLGGSFETSKVEIVKMKEHLSFLAQLFDGKAKRI